MRSETVRMEGHLVDSLTLSKTLDKILSLGADYRISEFVMGARRSESSRATIVVSASTEELLEEVLTEIQKQGAVREEAVASWVPAPADGVLPDLFYASTNLATEVRLASGWRDVAAIEMDCAIILKAGSPVCAPMHRVRRNDQVLVGIAGVRVEPIERPDTGDAFAFMGSGVSSERPKQLVISAAAAAIRAAHASGKKVLFVGGPAIIHTGTGPWLERLIDQGWIDVLFAGNALAAHDIEAALYGTSLGVELLSGRPAAHGHKHHLRAINTIRRLGSIRQAVESGALTSGVMAACVRRGVPFVLAGSIRDDGPLPDVLTDTLAAQDAMRAAIDGVGIALLVASTLHAVAVGNILPARVRTICVDTEPGTVIKLLDRGTHQAYGMVTDCAYFVRAIAEELEHGEK